MVDERADAAPVEHGRIAGVLAPRRGSRVGVVRDGQRQAAESVRRHDLGEPAEAPGDRHGRSADQVATALSGKLDERIRIGHRRGDRLLGKHVEPGLENRCADRAVRRSGREVEGRVEALLGEQAVEIGVRRRGRRPLGDGCRRALGSFRVRVAAGNDLHHPAQARQGREIPPMRDVAAADDPD